jgi:hypothetical protein
MCRERSDKFSVLVGLLPWLLCWADRPCFDGGFVNSVVSGGVAGDTWARPKSPFGNCRRCGLTIGHCIRKS